MENVIILAVLAVILALAVRYVVKAKKSGRKCVGCPESCCPSAESGCCNCNKY